MAYVVECLDCDEGNLELGSVKKVNSWIQQHLDENKNHTVSVFDENGTCITDISRGEDQVITEFKIHAVYDQH